VNISPLGDSALTVTFGNSISAELNDLVLAADEALNASPFTGFVETVPAYASISVFYDALEVRKSEQDTLSAFEIAKSWTESSLHGLVKVLPPAKLVEIPVSFAAADAPDLGLLAETKGLTPEQVVEIFLAQTYRVYMLGFLPGFSYLGQVDERIAMPRKSTPRTVVPKGSIGIAGLQTGIYSLDSPGGWQIIGRTSMEMFLPDQDPPVRLKAGDEVRFIRN
jgi:inhibitor of KinA